MKFQKLKTPLDFVWRRVKEKKDDGKVEQVEETGDRCGTSEENII